MDIDNVCLLARNCNVVGLHEFNSLAVSPFLALFDLVIKRIHGSAPSLLPVYVNDVWMLEPLMAPSKAPLNSRVNDVAPCPSLILVTNGSDVSLPNSHYHVGCRLILSFF